MFMKIKNNRILNKLLYLYLQYFCDNADHIELGYEGYCDYLNQDANDYVYDLLSTGKPCMISKFGSVELSNIVSRHIAHTTGLNKNIIHDFLHYQNVAISSHFWLNGLCTNAGFFPYDNNLAEQWYQMMIQDMSEIDVLGSYVYEEKYIQDCLQCEKKVNIEGYFAPYMWKRPWSRYLKGKRVLVVHPFVDSIKYQYEHNREKLFTDPEVLPPFKELLFVKAVQSQADSQDVRFKNWFEALQYMKDEIDKKEYDIALIGCGAYGMCLAAHVKRRGKQAVHLASMTQMLFGVYGNRWIKNEPKYLTFINDFWIRPNQKEKPLGADKIENGCYW